MNISLRIPKGLKLFFSKVSSLILLFQRNPIVQILLPEAKVMSTTGAAEIMKWTVAAVAGLGAYDTVAGASTVTQLTPVFNSATVPATQDKALSFTFQYGGSDTPDHFQVVGTLPPGLTQTKSRDSKTDTISGIPTVAGNTNITIKAWRNSAETSNSVSATFTIRVGGLGLVIVTQPTPVTINSGKTATLTVTATGTITSFQWYLGATGDITHPILNATSSSYTTAALTASATYWVRVKNPAGSVDSSAAKVTVIIPPTIIAQPASSIIKKGGTTKLTVTTSGSAAKYQWYLGSSGITTSPISGATSASFTTPALSSTTNYWVKVRNAAGSVSSTTAKVTVQIPPTITKQPTSFSIMKGGTATLSVSASGSSLIYQWYIGASGVTTKPISKATSSKYTTPALSASTQYWVKIKNAVGAVNSQAANVLVTSASFRQAAPSMAPAIQGTIDASIRGTFASWKSVRFGTEQLADDRISGQNADPDGDGISNNEEYLCGSDPLTANLSQSPKITVAAGQVSVSFIAKAAGGPGYEGLTRHYQLLANETLSPTAWHPASTETSDIPASDQTISVQPDPKLNRFYQLKIWLSETP